VFSRINDVFTVIIHGIREAYLVVNNP
jgi:hypothetical protein